MSDSFIIVVLLVIGQSLPSVHSIAARLFSAGGRVRVSLLARKIEPYIT